MEARQVPNTYFDELCKNGTLQAIKIDNIYQNMGMGLNDDHKEILRVYYIFLQAMISMKAEMIGLLKIEKNRKQNLLIYESLRSTLKNQNDDLYIILPEG